jgi:serine/threonine protein kinase/Tol biopolymer transport system component
MSVDIGVRLGPYEVVAPIGAGGMGEVYKARDTRLNRTVAIKILPASLAADPQFRERFEREAKAIAALAHPNICAIHDVGRQDGTEYLVLEYLEGETLESRLKRGALPLDQALAIAIQVAGALDKAHRDGIVHRDLKPANVFLTKGGAKLLDFGLAKTGGPAMAGASPSMLPTTPPNLTAQGTILGTFQYMAPEQIEGEEADARTDMFAFGVVLYEMLTGKKAFAGKTQASLFGAILKDEPPPISTVQPLTPRALDRVVRKCLAKDPDKRWQTAKDLEDELAWIAESNREDAHHGARIGTPATGTGRWLWAAGGALAASIVAAISWLSVTRADPRSAEPVRFTVAPPPGWNLNVLPPVNAFALSPDARSLVFAAASPEGQRLWLRPLESLESKLIPGTENATQPFWSADGQSIAFFSEGVLKRADLRGGTTRTLCNCAFGFPGFVRAGTWNRDNIILVANNGVGVIRLPAVGGEPAVLKQLNGDLDSARANNAVTPRFLEDGRHFLFVRGTAPADVSLTSLDGAPPQRVPGLRDTAEVAAGYAVFVGDGGALLAQRFDANRPEVTRDPVKLAEHIAVFGRMSAFSVVERALVYRHAPSTIVGFEWRGRDGAVLTTLEHRGDYQNFALAPDGTRVAVHLSGTTGPVEGIAIVDTRRNVPSVLARPGGFPVWSPDGETIVFNDGMAPTIRLVTKPATNGPASEILAADGNHVDPQPLDWSRDGRHVLFRWRDGAGPELAAVAVGGERKVLSIARSTSPMSGAFSPNGQWVAFNSGETGRQEIYVVPFPSTGPRWRISSSGGVHPRWRADGRELFYLDPQGMLMVADVDASASFRPGVPRRLFGTGLVPSPSGGQYAVGSDGQRFLLMLPRADNASETLTVVLNWATALKE